jgi:hypothetical protein
VNGLRFEIQAPLVASDPNRSDICLFVGFVARRTEQPLPAEIRRWVREQGWTSRPYGRESIDDLLNLPVPIDSWEIFDRLFAWERRPLASGSGAAGTYLGAAVRSYFAQGGRKCYLVRAGEPWPLGAPRAARLAQAERLLPGYFARLLDGSPLDRRGWRGFAHLFGLPDVSFLCLPDLADLFSSDPPPTPPPADEPLGPAEQFVECAEPLPPPPPDSPVRRLPAPRCGPAEYEDWAWALQLVADVLARAQREVQLVAALPLPAPQSLAARDPLSALLGRASEPGPLALALRQQPHRPAFASAFVQLAYPWVRTPGSSNLPERLESPDAVLAGLLARNALARGAFRSAAGLRLGDVYQLEPRLSRQQLYGPVEVPFGPRPVRTSLQERLSLFGAIPGALTLLADVTTSLDPTYRPASVNRLVSVVVRAARRLGEGVVFEPSGEALWGRLREAVANLLAALYQAGALRGATAEEAFAVRCDRGTMSQSDIDNGRAIVQVRFEPAAPIEQITVVLALDEGGQVSLLSAREAAEAA